MEIEELYDALQDFRVYIQSNMPFKQSFYVEEYDPRVEGHNATIGAVLVRVVDDKLINIFVKVDGSLTGWEIQDRIGFKFVDFDESENTHVVTRNEFIFLDQNYPDQKLITLSENIGEGDMFHLFLGSDIYDNKVIVDFSPFSIRGTEEQQVEIGYGGHIIKCELSNGGEWIVTTSGEYQRPT